MCISAKCAGNAEASHDAINNPMSQGQDWVAAGEAKASPKTKCSTLDVTEKTRLVKIYITIVMYPRGTCGGEIGDSRHAL
jgi:hypothetical protein